MSWLQTRSGKKFDLDNISLDDIDIEDIAYSLAGQTRFNAHMNFPVSVATHSVAVCRGMPAFLSKREKLSALLHDSAEAYIGDIINPVRNYLGEEFARLEFRLETAIEIKYGGLDFKSARIKAQDQAQCIYEAKHFMNHNYTAEFGIDIYRLPTPSTSAYHTIGPIKAAKAFLAEFDKWK